MRIYIAVQRLSRKCVQKKIRPGQTVCFEVMCPGDSLLAGDSLLGSNLSPGHFTSGGKLLRDSSTGKLALALSYGQLQVELVVDRA